MLQPEFEHLFYDPGIDSGSSCLPSDESGHCVRVLRHQPGDVIHIVNGSGSLYLCRIVDINGGLCIYTIIERFDNWKKRNFHIHIGISPTKNIARYEWFLEKAAELGIDEITPVVSKYTQRHRINFSRLNKILISAMKQSKQASLPKTNSLTEFRSFLSLDHSSSHRCIANHSIGAQSLNQWYKPGEDVLVIIGPEGGFSEEEINMAENSGFIRISLGQNRLRTETAGVAFTAMIQLLNQKDFI